MSSSAISASRRHRTYRSYTAVSAISWLAALSAAAPGGASELPSLDAFAFDTRAVVEIEPLETAAATRDALVAAIEEIKRIEALTAIETDDSLTLSFPADGVAALNRAAGRGPLAVDPTLAVALQRAVAFCVWSDRAFGPAGGRLNQLWGIRSPAAVKPSLTAMEIGAQSARCDRLQVDAEAGTATLAEGSRVDLWGFARGLAVDRAVEQLRSAGAIAGWVQIGQVMRVFGTGPRGGAWPMLAVPDPEQPELTERVLLRDRAMAMASIQAGSYRAGDASGPAFVSHRTGRPPRGVVAVLTVTELALDAQALATTLFVLPNREGEYRLASLTPPPAVKWLLGDGTGRPLVTETRWAELEKWLPPRRQP